MEVHYSEQVSEVVPKPSVSRRLFRWLVIIFIAILLFCVGFAAYVWHLSTPPPSFPVSERITIEEGSTVRDITEQFAAAGYVRSELLLYLTIVSLHDPTTLKASLYRFDEPLDTFELAYRLTEGDYGIDLKRFVHYEGERARDIAASAEGILIDFDTEKFLELSEPFEGRLFPDTYLIPETYTAEELVELMTEAYESRISPLRPAIEQSPFSEDEVLTFASILEREANSRVTKRIVSGILHNRMEIDMPLQVDAVFEYILDKSGTLLTLEDLKVDHPYNTYINPGLPPGPIGNPGLEAIEAVLEPDPSSYLFYITGRDGNFYYANTYQQHLRNVNAYLR